MVVEPEQVAPGEQVAPTFPEQTLRGLFFVLQQQAGDGWQLRAYLTSAPGGGPPSRRIPALQAPLHGTLTG